MDTVIPPTIEVHLTPADLRAAMEADVRAGLATTPKELPPVYFYDDRGSRLFDEITRLPEYYPTRAERSILESHAKDMVRAAGADVLVELGAGTCDKSRILLDAMRDNGRLGTYVPLDVSDTTLWEAATALSEAYPGLAVRAVVGDFHRHLDRLDAPGRRLFAFLGGTIGNFHPGQRTEFLAGLVDTMRPGDRFLLGNRRDQGPRPARGRLRRLRRGHRRVQPQRAPRPQPRARRRLRRRPVRPCGPVERGRAPHRDVAAVARRLPVSTSPTSTSTSRSRPARRC